MELIDKYYERVSIIDTHNQIAYKFFNCYSRFEYALKESGFVYTNGRGQVAMASLKRYANSIESTLDLKSESIKGAVNYLIAEPPNELLWVAGALIWNPKIKNDSINFILDCLRTVRNNLFHGNKMFEANNVKRNIRLIMACLTIMNELIDQNNSVRDHFFAH